ncbi:MAG: DUF4847 domain-containing protein [Prevotellaceae bacterium]|nr:DUF4847 domain-containing protein [Prevotellaceae bacterium]
MAYTGRRGRRGCTVGALLCLALLLPLLGGCNNSDDVELIFNGKSWKLARLTDDGSADAFYDGLWSTDAQRQSSIEALSQSGYFTVQTTCTNEDGTLTGTLSAHAITGSISNAVLTVDASTRKLSIDGTISGSESDPLGIAFLEGLQGVYKYEGDTHNLTLYYKNGSKTRVIGLVAR